MPQQLEYLRLDDLTHRQQLKDYKEKTSQYEVYVRGVYKGHM